MKTIFKLLLIGLFFALIALGFISCGARHIQKHHSKEETRTEQSDNSITEKQTEINVKKTTEVKTDDKNETVTQEIVYEPSDNTKESFVIEKDGTKVILNNAKKIVRNTAQKNNTKSESKENVNYESGSNIKEQKSIEQASESTKENTSKKGERQQFSLYHLLWIIIPAGLIYYLYRRYKFF